MLWLLFALLLFVNDAAKRGVVFTICCLLVVAGCLLWLLLSFLLFVNDVAKWGVAVAALRLFVAVVVLLVLLLLLPGVPVVGAVVVCCVAVGAAVVCCLCWLLFNETDWALEFGRLFCGVLVFNVSLDASSCVVTSVQVRCCFRLVAKDGPAIYTFVVYLQD